MSKTKADTSSDDEKLTEDQENPTVEADEATQTDLPESDEPAPSEDAESDDTPEITEDLDADEEVTEAQDATEDTSEDSPEDAPEADASEHMEQEELSEPEAPEIPEAPAEPPTPVAPQPEPQRRSVFPMLLAGIVTAGAGYVAGQGDLLNSFFPNEDSQRVAIADFTDLQADVATLSKSLTDANATIADLNDKLANLPAPTSEIPQDVLDRIAALENQEPTGTQGGVSTDFAVQFSDLKSSAEEQQSELRAMLDQLQAREEAAKQNADRSQANAAMAQINAALGAGEPFADALSALQSAVDVDVPQALSAAAANGAPSLTEIQEGVTDAARAGLSAARDETAGTGGFAAFVQRQLGARSLAPQEGDSPDAVLSRVEDAVRRGDLPTALQEAEALPDSAKAAMAEWLTQTQTRSDVLQAAEAVNAQLNG